MADASSYITGLGGVFFKCADADKTREWYAKTLGMPIDPSYGGVGFKWRHMDAPDTVGQTIWSPFSGETDYFAPSKSDFMINLRVADLDGLLKHLKSQGIESVGDVVDEVYGRFAGLSTLMVARSSFGNQRARRKTSPNEHIPPMFDGGSAGARRGLPRP